MNELPFQMTDETAAWFQKTLFESQREPELVVLAPFLTMTSDTKEEGTVTSYFALGWNRLERVQQTFDMVELDLAGFKVYTFHIVLACLRRCGVVEISMIRNIGNVSPNPIDEFFWQKNKRKT